MFALRERATHLRGALIRQPWCLLLALALPALSAGPCAAAGQATPAAVVDFNYVDTSGEPSDQSAVHQARLAAFMRSLRDDLVRSRKFKLVSLTCAPDPCSIAQTQPAEILEAARGAGARLLLFGGIHKESTLIQWAKVQAVDLKADKPILDRLFTFRGDTDEAWRRAEAFIAGQVNALAISE